MNFLTLLISIFAFYNMEKWKLFRQQNQRKLAEMFVFLRMFHHCKDWIGFDMKFVIWEMKNWILENCDQNELDQMSSNLWTWIFGAEIEHKSKCRGWLGSCHCHQYAADWKKLTQSRGSSKIMCRGIDSATKRQTSLKIWTKMQDLISELKWDWSLSRCI